MNMNVEEVFKRGKKIRAEQDKAIALFIKQIRSVENMDSLESIKTELLKGSC